MKSKIILFFAFISTLTSCVSESEHNRLEDEKVAIEKERDSLKKVIEDIKFGAPNLLADGKKFFEANDYTAARQKLEELVKRHSDLPESIEAKRIIILLNEEDMWNKAITSEVIADTEKYISNYPDGKYSSKAKINLQDLKIKNEQKDYDNAIAENSSSTWNKFLKDYPNNPKASEIREKIIRLEVDEIMGDKQTGRMPESIQYSSSYSSQSKIEVTNDTGCELTVRYSGTQAKSISIASGSTAVVYLSSGSYRVAASACGSNYAGQQSFTGNYGSKFYISRTRY